MGQEPFGRFVCTLYERNGESQLGFANAVALCRQTELCLGLVSIRQASPLRLSETDQPRFLRRTWHVVVDVLSAMFADLGQDLTAVGGRARTAAYSMELLLAGETKAVWVNV